MAGGVLRLARRRLRNKRRTELCRFGNRRPKRPVAGRARGYVRSMAPRLKPKQQGDLGEADAIAVLTRLGGEVSVPLFSAPDYDLVVDFGDGLQRVQVKTSTREVRPGVFGIQICTNGGNQSWNGLVRMFDRARCDLLYAAVADGRRWLIPSVAVEARRQLNLGGSKYSEYEISASTSGEDDNALCLLEWSPPRGGAGVGEPGRSVKSVPYVLRGFDSLLPIRPFRAMRRRRSFQLESRRCRRAGRASPLAIS